MNFLVSLAACYESISLIQMAIIYGVTFSIYYFLLRKKITSIFDPIFMASCGSALATAYMGCLYAANLVGYNDFIWVVSCTVLYYLGIITGDSLKLFGISKATQTVPPQKVLLFIMLCFLLLNQTLLYSIVGNPLLMDSRLDQFKEGGGVGILGRFFDAILMPLLFLAFYRLKSVKTDILSFFIIVVCSIFLFLTGSKAALINIFIAKFFADIGSNYSKTHGKKNNYFYIIILFFVALIVIYIQSENRAINNISDILVSFGIRVIAFGDGYSYAYVNEVVHKISKKDPFALLQFLTQPLRIVSSETLVVPGFELIKEVHGVVEANKGPNPRLPVYIDFYYDRYMLFVVPLVGFILGVIRSAALNSTIVFSRRIFFICLYIWLCAFETDPVLSLNGVFNTMITFAVFITVYIIIGSVPQNTIRNAHQKKYYE